MGVFVGVYFSLHSLDGVETMLINQIMMGRKEKEKERKRLDTEQ